MNKTNCAYEETKIMYPTACSASTTSSTLKSMKQKKKESKKQSPLAVVEDAVLQQHFSPGHHNYHHHHHHHHLSKSLEKKDSHKVFHSASGQNLSNLNAVACSSGFEGPEKRLQMVFVANQESYQNSGSQEYLRSVTRDEWQELVLDHVRCNIISYTAGDYCDSYVLSESSLFVYPQMLMIKTCGTTTLLNCVEKILQLVEERFPELQVASVIYSRKNFVFPKNQPTPYQQGFDKEVQLFLKKHFDGADYCTLGPVKRDHWNLYVYQNEKLLNQVTQTYYEDLLDDATIVGQPQFEERNLALHPQSATLEILMHDLDVHKMRQFFKTDDFIDSQDTTQRTGIADLIPGSHIDSFQFDPCGYSMNGLIDQYFWTIHITPEPAFSYVSFETNMPSALLPNQTYQSLVKKVLDCFRPGRYQVTVLSNVESIVKQMDKEMSQQRDDDICVCQKRHQFAESYHLSYANFDETMDY